MTQKKEKEHEKGTILGKNSKAGLRRPHIHYEYEVWADGDRLVAFGNSPAECAHDLGISQAQMKSRYTCQWVCFLDEGECPDVDTDHDGGKTKTEALKNLANHPWFNK